MGIFNFDNIGEKMKKLAKWCCWIGIVLDLVASVVCFVGFLLDDTLIRICWVPLAGCVVYPFLIWIGCWPLYAFGDIVEKVEMMSLRTVRIDQIQKDVNTLTHPEESETKVKLEFKLSQDTQSEIKGKPLTEHLEYALRYQTDSGMISYLRSIKNEVIDDILERPEAEIRPLVRGLLNKLKGETE